MAANKRKILEAARKYAQKGSKDRALKEYEKLLKLDPRDAKLRLEIGDAYRRWGQLDEAIGTYTKVAEQYMAEGFDARAVAVFKQIVNLDPDRWAAYEPLAELYQRMGLASEAIQTLQAAADGYHKSGQRRPALELLRRMASIDPTNTTSRLKVADLLRQEKLADEAILEYESAAEELERQGEHEQVVRALERVLELDPDRTAALARIAQGLLQLREADRAEPFARRLLDAEPEVVEHYELLAEVHRVQKREDALADVYRRLAELYRRRGDEDRAREITQRFVPPSGLVVGQDSVTPDDLLDDGMQGDVSGFLEDELSAAPALEEDLLAPAADEPARPPMAESTVLHAEDEPLLEEEKTPPPEATLPDVDSEQLLAEACVYLRYGKRKQAIQNLEAIVARDARHREALEKLGEAFADGGEQKAAVDAWVRAARVADAEGAIADFDVLRGRIAALDPAAAATLGPAPAAPPAQPEPAPDLPLGEDDEFLEVSQPVAPPLEAEAPEADEPAIEEPAAEESVDLADDIEIEIDEPEVEGPDLEEPAAEESVDLADDIEIDTDLGDHELEVDSQDGIDLEGDVAVGAEPPTGPDDVAAQSPSASSSASQQVQEDLEEAEFYRSQGLLEEAAAIYERILQVAPNHPQALVRMGEIAAARGDAPDVSTSGMQSAPTAQAAGEDEASEGVGHPDDVGDWTDGLGEGSEADEGLAPEPSVEVAETQPEVDEDPGDTAEEIPAAAPPQVAAGEGDFDLAAELSDALDTGAAASGSQGEDSFAAIFSEFKKGVSKTLSEGDHEAHYDLGIAYREMGLFDDAMGEFRAAMEKPERRIGCLHMLGQCALELGRAEEAAGHLEQALGEGDLPDEQRLPMRFDLGRAFEALGDLERARGAYEEVAAVDPSFEDVEQRIASLESGAKPEPVEAAEPDYEDFGDVIEEAALDDDEDGAEEGGVDFDDVVQEMEDDEEPPGSSVPETQVDFDDGDDEPPPEDPPKRRRKKISFV